jgi:hypothetical protein
MQDHEAAAGSTDPNVQYAYEDGIRTRWTTTPTFRGLHLPFFPSDRDFPIAAPVSPSSLPKELSVVRSCASGDLSA